MTNETDQFLSQVATSRCVPTVRDFGPYFGSDVRWSDRTVGLSQQLIGEECVNEQTAYAASAALTAARGS